MLFAGSGNKAAGEVAIILKWADKGQAFESGSRIRCGTVRIY